jgi:ankyrin repeat protein
LSYFHNNSQGFYRFHESMHIIFLNKDFEGFKRILLSNPSFNLEEYLHRNHDKLNDDKDRMREWILFFLKDYPKIANTYLAKNWLTDALLNNDIELTKTIVSVNPEIIDDINTTKAFMLSLEKGGSHALDLLLQHHFHNLDFKNTEKMIAKHSALSHLEISSHIFKSAIQRRKEKLVRIMTDANPSLLQSEGLDLSISSVCDSSSTNLVEFLFEKEPSLANTVTFSKVLAHLLDEESIRLLNVLLNTNPALAYTPSAAHCLLHAMQLNNLDAVKSLLDKNPALIYSKQGAEVHKRFFLVNRGLRVIWQSAENKLPSNPLAKEMEEKASLLKRDLFHAINTRDLKHLKEIISKCQLEQISLDQRNKLGQTALAISLAKGDFDLATILMDAGSNPNAKDLLGNTPFEYAIAYNGNQLKELDSVTLHCIESGANLEHSSPSGGSIFSQILTSGRKNLLYEAIKSGINPSQEEIKEAFLTVIRTRPLSEKESRYQNRATWNSLTPEQVNFCLSKLNNLFVKQERAVGDDSSSDIIIQKLLNEKDSFGRTPVMNAILYGNPFSLSYLIQSGADLSLQDAEGLRAIDHLCVSPSFPKANITASMLHNLTKFATVEHTRKIQTSPLYFDTYKTLEPKYSYLLEKAVIGHKLELAKWLFSRGLLPKEESKDVFTNALHHYIQNQSQKDRLMSEALDEMDFLITMGADPNHRRNGILPLNEAIKNQNLDMALFLLKRKADFTLKDKDGMDALSVLAKVDFSSLKSSPMDRSTYPFTNIWDRLFDQLVRSGFSIPEKSDSNSKEMETIHGYIKTALHQKNTTFLCKMIENGFKITGSKLETPLRNFMRTEKGFPIATAYFNQTWNQDTQEKSAVPDPEKERLKSETWSNQMYNEAIVMGQFKIANQIKMHIENQGHRLNMNLPDSFGRTALFNSVLAGNTSTTLNMIKKDPSSLDLTKTDVFGDNIIHYLCGNLFPKQPKFIQTDRKEFLYSDPAYDQKNQEALLHEILNYLTKKVDKTPDEQKLLHPTKMKEYLDIALNASNVFACKKLVQTDALQSFKVNFDQTFLATSDLKPGTMKPSDFERGATLSKLLALAASHGDYETLRSIHKSGIPIDIKDIRFSGLDDTPLLKAIKNHKLQTACVLLDLGANPNHKDALGVKPLMAFCQNPNLEKKVGFRTPSEETSMAHYQSLFNSLLQKTEGLEEPGGFARTYIDAALKSNNIRTAKTLIGIGKTLYETMTPQDSELQLEKRKFPYVFNTLVPTPLAALLPKDIIYSELQFVNGYKPDLQSDPQWSKPLMVASAMSNEKEVLHLLQSGIGINSRDKTGRTPLSMAAEFGNLDILRVLVHQLADLNTTDKKGKTALDYAVENKKYKNVAYLVGKNKDLHASEQSIRHVFERLNDSPSSFTAKEKEDLYAWISQKAGVAIVHLPQKQPTSIVLYRDVKKMESFFHPDSKNTKLDPSPAPPKRNPRRAFPGIRKKIVPFRPKAILPHHPSKTQLPRSL